MQHGVGLFLPAMGWG